MDRRLWILLCATALLLAAQGMAAGVAAPIPVLDTLRRVEEDVMLSILAQGEEEAAYPLRRVLQSGGQIRYNALQNKQACSGSCPAPGRPYTPGCQRIYQCRG